MTIHAFDKYQADVSDLSSGLDLVSVSSAGRTIYKGKLVKTE